MKVTAFLISIATVLSEIMSLARFLFTIWFGIYHRNHREMLLRAEAIKRSVEETERERSVIEREKERERVLSIS